MKTSDVVIKRDPISSTIYSIFTGTAYIRPKDDFYHPLDIPWREPAKLQNFVNQLIGWIRDGVVSIDAISGTQTMTELANKLEIIASDPRSCFYLPFLAYDLHSVLDRLDMFLEHEGPWTKFKFSEDDVN